MTSPEPDLQPEPLIRPFPTPGPQIQLAYRELETAAGDDDAKKKALGPIADLPRPWAPATCTKPQMRAQLWIWLDEVVVWLNRQMVFDVADLIPACWPQHAHLVHEIAVLADLRRSAELAVTSDAMEEWHRYALPAFLERMRHRVAQHCEDEHARVWPAGGRFSRHLDVEHVKDRQRAFTADVNAARGSGTTESPTPESGPRLHVVDTSSGEILD